MVTCENDLIEQARQGDQEAFRHLWEAHHGVAMAAALRLCHQRALAEEITQGAFLLAWRGLPRFQGANFQKNVALVEQLEALAKEKGATAGQLALAWVLAQGEDIVPIPGTKRRHYLEQNVQATEIVLTAADLKRINALAQPAGARYDAASLRIVNA